jgi:hypothetical protein
MPRDKHHCIMWYKEWYSEEEAIMRVDYLDYRTLPRLKLKLLKCYSQVVLIWE